MAMLVAKPEDAGAGLYRGIEAYDGETVTLIEGEGDLKESLSLEI